LSADHAAWVVTWASSDLPFGRAAKETASPPEDKLNPSSKQDPERPESSGRLGIPAIVGIIVGAIGALIFAGLVLFFLLKRRRQKKVRGGYGGPNTGNGRQWPAEDISTAELDSKPAPVEVAGTRDAAEVYGDSHLDREEILGDTEHRKELHGDSELRRELEGTSEYLKAVAVGQGRNEAEIWDRERTGNGVVSPMIPFAAGTMNLSTKVSQDSSVGYLGHGEQHEMSQTDWVQLLEEERKLDEQRKQVELKYLEKEMQRARDKRLKLEAAANQTK